jgi:methionine synthase II (cobalamin-independent)
MKRSPERILTTHTGSLPRAAKVVEILLAEQQNRGPRKAEFNAAVSEAIALVVQKQIECGIDIINEGEQGRTDYTVHVLDRLAGFAGESTPPLGTGDPEFPELAQLLTHFASPFQYRPSCTGEAIWKDWAAAQADIDLSKNVMKGANAAELFMTSPSPGQIARYLKNKHYKTEEAYVYALADVMKRVLTAKPMAVSFPAANARHEHEWKIWREVTLPAANVIVPGVTDSTVNTVEHPEVVADRIVNFAHVVGRDNVIAGVDCGFGTFAGRVQVDSKIVWLKLQALAEGARRASAQLWAKAA